ncbi:MAG TPA: hypothetical protein VGO91_14635, partial [Pyrinomonadaceae bacterium]|nr:hypothetical protein [Pyrinomonadaceae bacterium]
MKRLARFSLILTLLLGCSVLSYAQGFRIESTLPPPLGSETFTSLDGRFSIALPKQFSGYQPKSTNTPAGRIEAVLYTWETASGKFGVAYIDRPEPLESVGKAVMDSFRDNFVAKAGSGKGKLIGETELSLDGYVGRELKIEFPDGLYLFRMYLVKQRMYQTSVMIPNDKRAQAETAAKALASFKLLTPADVEAEMKRKIAEATPGPLPQEPVAQKLKSDAEDDGLKGKVKTIFSDEEDLTGTWTVIGRKPHARAYYNERGNLTKEEAFDYRGNVSNITVYGYIDGERASKYGYIQYEYDPPPMMMPAAPGQPKPIHDKRYTNKYRYKYDDKGKLIERLNYGNDGKLRSRYVYLYNGNQKEGQYYSDDELYRKELMTLDAQGNEIERTSIEQKPNMTTKYSYTYEFDAKGNWIKKTTSKLVTKDGKSSLVPSW